MSLNKAMLIGNVGSDPEVRYTDNSKVARIRLATTDRYKDKSGEVKESTEWHDISVFGKTADFVENYVKKGAQLFVEGKIRTRVYKDKNNIERTAFGVVADSVQLLSKTEKQEKKTYVGEPSAKTMQEADRFIDDTELPF